MKIRHYITASGREPVKDFIEELPLQTRNEVLTLLRRIENGETLQMPHARSLASIARDLFELRVRDAAGQVRVFYFTKMEESIFLVHAIRKKKQIIPEKDRDLILKRLRELKRYK